LRKFLFVMAVLSALLGWLAMQWRWLDQRRAALRWIHDVRARQLAVERGESPPPRKGTYVQTSRSPAPWSLRLLGEQGVGRLRVYRRYIESQDGYELDELRRLFPEAEVRIVQKGPARR
jgi:hypothetical protein